jgi:hypothetical protein
VFDGASFFWRVGLDFFVKSFSFFHAIIMKYESIYRLEYCIMGCIKRSIYYDV